MASRRATPVTPRVNYSALVMSVLASQNEPFGQSQIPRLSQIMVSAGARSDRKPLNALVRHWPFFVWSVLLFLTSL
jgi:hypothetical protein